MYTLFDSLKKSPQGGRATPLNVPKFGVSSFKDTGMKFCCASNVGLKNVKIARKKTFFTKCF